MQYKLKNLNSWKISILLHLLFICVTVAIYSSSRIKSKPEVVIDVLEAPKPASKAVEITDAKPPPKKARAREVFGVSRKAAFVANGEEVKLGNTLTKAPDQEKLKSDDPDSIPIPSEEYLITKMPELKNEVRIPYPTESKKKGIQGAVIMDLLIDSLGKVREATLVEGPNPELSQAALVAVKDFQFSPALIQEKTVAVRIRYAYRFLIEH